MYTSSKYVQRPTDIDEKKCCLTLNETRTIYVQPNIKLSDNLDCDIIRINDDYTQRK